MPGVSALIATIISCSVGMCGILCGVIYFSISSVRREIDSLRTELTAVIKKEIGDLRTEIATARTEEFKQKLLKRQ